MRMAKTAAETLIAAAERLEFLDGAATRGPWIPEGDRIEANFWSTDQEEFVDILVYGGFAEAGDYDLMATLRPIAGPLAAHFRAEARIDRRDYPGLIDIARAIVGEVTA